MISRSGRTIWHGADWALSFASQPIDISNDGKEDFVLQGYSGGAHCCWTYTVLSTKGPPYLLSRLKNERDADFTRMWRGKRIISTLDGGFDYFYASHAATFFPPVYLLLEGSTVYDISGEKEFRSEYDDLIKEARTELKKRDPTGQFKSQRVELMDETIRSLILQIVESYLYSRRTNQAWSALREWWPAYDVNHVMAEILKIRRSGILKRAIPFQGKPEEGK